MSESSQQSPLQSDETSNIHLKDVQLKQLLLSHIDTKNKFKTDYSMNPAIFTGIIEEYEKKTVKLLDIIVVNYKCEIADLLDKNKNFYGQEFVNRCKKFTKNTSLLSYLQKLYDNRYYIIEHTEKIKNVFVYGIYPYEEKKIDSITDSELLKILNCF